MPIKKKGGDIMINWILLVRKAIVPVKVVVYFWLAVLLYVNFIGPEGVAELLKIENPLKEGSDLFALIIPEKVIELTIATVILECIDNFLSMFEPFQHK
jgi:hypothetical protein